MQIETVRQQVKELSTKRPELATRIERAGQILATKEVQRIGVNLYRVESQSKPGSFHLVELGPRSCGCYDFTSGRAPKGFCKHVIAVIMAQKAQERETVESRGQMFAHLVNQGVPVMAALQQVRG